MSQTSQSVSDVGQSMPARPRVKPTPASAKRETPTMFKSDVVLKKLRSAKGASIQQLAEATGWQMHSVRGFLSATVRKKLNLNLVSDVGKGDVRRYRIAENAETSSS